MARLVRDSKGDGRREPPGEERYSNNQCSEGVAVVVIAVAVAVVAVAVVGGMCVWQSGRASKVRSADKYWFLRDSSESSTERARQHDAAPTESKQAAGHIEPLALQGTSCPSYAKSSRSTACSSAARKPLIKPQVPSLRSPYYAHL